MTRPMGNFHVEQRTKDGMFNATALLKQWNLNTQNSGDLKKKDMDDFFVNKNVDEWKLKNNEEMKKNPCFLAEFRIKTYLCTKKRA